MRRILFFLLMAFTIHVNAQYIGVKAKYTQTRLVPNDDPSLQDSRDNRLVLSFYEVTFNGTELVWTPTFLTNYDIWIEPAGLQFGNLMGGVLDSVGNNYPGYPYTAPRAVAYYNSMGVNYFDCSPFYGTHYIVNGHELDCGWVRVSTWEWNESMQRENEYFNAPNINVPYYWFGHPYYSTPGNVNFNYYDLGAGPPYNMYNFVCGTLQLVMKGLLLQDTGSAVNPLPVNFAFVRGEIQGTNTARIFWSNLTESDIDRYEIQRSTDNNSFVSIDTIAPKSNNHDRADYDFSTLQLDKNALYKIKAIEHSGKMIYSSIISLRLADTNGPLPDEPALIIYPNPVKENLISFRLRNAEKGRYVAMVVTPDGKLVKQKIIEHEGGDLVRQVEIENLLSGVYHLVIRFAFQKFSQQFIYTY